MTRHQVLDHGYVDFIERWGSDEAIIRAARMSTGKGFLGWGPTHTANCATHRTTPGTSPASCDCACNQPGDEKLLRYLWEHKHATPFEMAGLVIEVKAPIFVFREWHRHRTQSYNEMSARYIPLPDETYLPTLGRLLLPPDGATKQAQSTGATLTAADATAFQQRLAEAYAESERVYRAALAAGVPKELARAVLPVGRYSRMRASANLRNWLAFLTLRMDPAAQWEIRQYANAVGELIALLFPRTWEIYCATNAAELRAAQAAAKFLERTEAR